MPKPDNRIRDALQAAWARTDNPPERARTPQPVSEADAYHDAADELWFRNHPIRGSLSEPDIPTPRIADAALTRGLRIVPRERPHPADERQQA